MKKRLISRMHEIKLTNNQVFFIVLCLFAVAGVIAIRLIGEILAA
ncbi:hypothetical protein [Ewingella americana]|nr:hypothetical protein [Ewingella americana]